MAREVWDVRLSTSAGDLVLPAPDMNGVTSLLATAYSMAIFAISRLEGSAGCGSSAILRLASCAGCPIGVTFRPNRRLHHCLSIGPVLLRELTFCTLRSS